MENHQPQINELKGYFEAGIREQFRLHVVSRGDAPLESYLADLLVRFATIESIFGVKDAAGRSVQTVSAMIEEGDIRYKATSFERERQVHRHIGDFILFWQGLNPGYMNRHLLGSAYLNGDPLEVGRISYKIVGSFDDPPHDAEAPLYLRLADGYEDCSWVLAQVARQSGLFAA